MTEAVVCDCDLHILYDRFVSFVHYHIMFSQAYALCPIHDITHSPHFPAQISSLVYDFATDRPVFYERRSHTVNRNSASLPENSKNVGVLI